MGKGMMSQKFCCEPVSFKCSDFINNCVQNYSTYILRNNQLFCGPQGLLGPKSCSSVTILRARLGAATGERGQGIRCPGLSGVVLTGGSVLGNKLSDHRGLQADFLSLEFETVLPLDWSLWRRSTGHHPSVEMWGWTECQAWGWSGAGGREVGGSRPRGRGGRLALALPMLDFPYSHLFSLL